MAFFNPDRRALRDFSKGTGCGCTRSANEDLVNVAGGAIEVDADGQVAECGLCFHNLQS